MVATSTSARTQPAPSARARARAWLLLGTALGAAAMLGLSGQAVAGGMPVQGASDLSVAGAGSLTGKTAYGGPDVPVAYAAAATGGGVTADIDVSANAKTLIDWTSFTVAAGNTVNFHFSGDLATADSQIVINRVLTPSSKIDIEGAVNGVRGPSGGNPSVGAIWFLDNAGIIVNGSISANDVVLSTGTVDLASFFNASSYSGALAALALTSTQSLIDIDSVQSAFSATLDPATGDILLTAAGGPLGVRHAVAGRDLILSAPGDVNALDVNAARDISLTSTGGAVAVKDYAYAGGDVTVQGQTGARLRAANLFGSGPHNVLVEAVGGGDAVLGSEGAIDATDYIATDPGGSTTASVKTLAGSGNVVVGLDSVDAQSSFGSVTSFGGDASVIVNAGDAALQSFGGANLFVNVAGAFSVANSPTVDGDYIATAGAFGSNALNTVTAPHDFIIEDTGTSLAVAYDLAATNNLSVQVDNGGFTAPDLGAAAGFVHVNATGDIKLQSASAGADVSIVSGSGGAASVGSATAGTDITVEGGTGAALGGASLTGDDSAVRHLIVSSDAGAAVLGAPSLSSIGASNSVTAASSNANTDVEVASQGPVGVGDALAYLHEASSASGTAPLTIDVLTSAHSDAAAVVQTGSGAAADLRVGIVSAGRDVALASGAGSVVVSPDAGASGGTIDAGDDVAVRAAGGLSVDGTVTSGEGAEGVGAADTLAAAQPMTMFGHTYGVLTDGSHIDIVAGAGGVQIGGAVTANGGDIRIQTTGALAAPSLDAGRDVALDVGAADLGFSPVTAGADVAVKSAGDADLGQVSAGDDVAIRAVGAVTLSGSLTSGASGEAVGAADYLVASSGQAMTVFGQTYGVLTDGSQIDIVAGGSLTLPFSTLAQGSGSDVRLQSLSGSISTADVTAGRDVVMDASGSIGFAATGAIADADNPIRAIGRDVAIWSHAGDIALKSVEAGDDIVLRAPSGSIAVLDALASDGTGDDTPGAGDALAAAAPILLFGSPDKALTGGGMIDVGAGQVVVQNAAGAGAAVASGAGAVSDVRILATGPDSSAPAISIGGAVSAGQDAALDADSGAGGSILVSGGIGAGRDIAVRSLAGSLEIGSGQAGEDIVLRAGTSASVDGGLSAGGAAKVQDDPASFGDLLFGTDKTSLATAFDLLGADIDVKSGQGAIRIGGASSAPTDVRLQAGQGSGGGASVSSGDITAGRDVFLDGASVGAGALVATAGDIAVRGRSGAVGLGSGSAGDAIVIRAQGQVTTGALTTEGSAAGTGLGAALADEDPIAYLLDANASDPVTTFASAGPNIDVAGGAITASGPIASAADARFQAGGGASFAGVSSVGTTFVRASALAIDPSATWTAPVIRIESTSADGLVVGDPATAPAGSPMRISNATFGQFQGPSGGSARILFFAGDSSGSERGPLGIGTLTVKAQNRIGEIDLYAGGGASNPVTVTGAFAPDTNGETAVVIGSTVAANDWTPGSILVINDGDGGVNKGSIGAATILAPPLGQQTISNVLAFKSVELNATDDILMGSSLGQGGQPGFIAQMAAANQGDVQNLLKGHTEQVLASGSPAMLLAAGSLTVRANGKIIQQNTAGFGSGFYTGVYLTGDGVAANTPPTPILQIGRISGLAASGAPVPNNVEMFLSLVDGGTTLTGQAVALSDRVGLISGLTPSQFFRVNYCVIYSPGNCTPLSLPSVNVQPARVDLADLLRRAGLQDIEDPTVTGAANEEIWRKPE